MQSFFHLPSAHLRGFANTRYQQQQQHGLQLLKRQHLHHLRSLLFFPQQQQHCRTLVTYCSLDKPHLCSARTFRNGHSCLSPSHFASNKQFFVVCSSWGVLGSSGANCSSSRRALALTPSAQRRNQYAAATAAAAAAQAMGMREEESRQLEPAADAADRSNSSSSSRLVAMREQPDAAVAADQPGSSCSSVAFSSSNIMTGATKQHSSDSVSVLRQDPAAAAVDPPSKSSSSSRGSSVAANSRTKPGSIKQSSSSSGLVVNKEPISSSMSPQLYSYLLSHTREPEILAQLRKETALMHGGHMQIAPEQGELLALLVELLGAKSAIEVGVFTGYSSLAVALALPADGRLVAFDRDAKTMSIAQRYWEKAGVAHKVDGRLGPAEDGLRELLQQEGENSFEMAFIDADKRSYQSYFDHCLRLVRPGGLIAVDNVLFYGKVADPEAQDKATKALKRFNSQLMTDERVTYSIVPIGDGMALCRKR